MSLRRHYSGLVVGLALLLAGCAGVPPAPPPSPSTPAAGFGPLPGNLQKEIQAFYASFDRAIEQRDLNEVMGHFTPDVAFSYRAFYPGMNLHVRVRRNDGEILWYYQINLAAIDPNSVQELRQGWEYRPGITRDVFEIRYRSYPGEGDGSFRVEPFTAVTVQFRRTGGMLQIRAMDAENLAAPDPPRTRTMK